MFVRFNKKGTRQYPENLFYSSLLKPSFKLNVTFLGRNTTQVFRAFFRNADSIAKDDSNANSKENSKSNSNTNNGLISKTDEKSEIETQTHTIKLKNTQTIELNLCNFDTYFVNSQLYTQCTNDSLITNVRKECHFFVFHFILNDKESFENMLALRERVLRMLDFEKVESYFPCLFVAVKRTKDDLFCANKSYVCEDVLCFVIVFHFVL